MGFPLFRVTLSNDIEGSLVISEPGGWDDAKLKLERNMEFHSLVEFYDQPLMFYGADNENNGGLDYIRNIEQTQGIDAQITILIEISLDEGDNYEVCVEQTLEIESVKETDFYKAEFGVIRNGFWQNFMNRKGTPVDLLSTTDLDGEIRDAINAVTIQLPSQKIRQEYSGEDSFGVVIYEADVVLNDFIQVGFDNIIIGEIEQVFTIFTGYNGSLPAWILEPKYPGSYRIVSKIEMSLKQEIGTIGFSTGTFVTDPTSAYINVYYQKNDETPVVFSTTNYAGQSTVYDTDVTLDLVQGDQIYIYGVIESVAWKTAQTVDNILVWGNDNSTVSIYRGTFNPVDASLVSVSLTTVNFGTAPSTTVIPTTLDITADTLYTDTDCEGFFIHEAGNAITDRIIGRDGTFYSEYLGNTLTQIQNYAEDGCGSKYAVTRGLNVRGYTLAEKPFFMSFDTWWNGINPILNLGLGYEVLGSPELEVLRIEPKSYFYNPTTSVDFDFVNNIERSYDVNFVFKAIEIGFEKWSAESASGVDDPQSKRVYNTRFKTVGQEIKILSKFIGASLAIEQTRRNRVEQGKDWRLDDDVMIIAMSLDGSPEFQPELDENFTSVTNLINPETRYNIRLSVARNFERWKDFFNGCLQWYVSDGDDYRFASGEGNFDMTSTLDGGDCEANGTIDEKGNIAVTDDFLFMPIVYTFEHPMTWEQYKTIRDNRNNAIGVSRTDENHLSCFIMELEYQITHGKATFTVVTGENSNLTDDWILQDGTWNDSLYWRDSKLWID